MARPEGPPPSAHSLFLNLELGSACSPAEVSLSHIRQAGKAATDSPRLACSQQVISRRAIRQTTREDGRALTAHLPGGWMLEQTSEVRDYLRHQKAPGLTLPPKSHEMRRGCSQRKRGSGRTQTTGVCYNSTCSHVA